MKRIIVFTAVILLLPALAQAQLLPAGPRPRDLASPAQTAVPEARLAPAYTFTKLPTAIIVNYYDYMIGSYSGLPLRVIPPSAGGGYFMTYHGRRQPTAVRRVFFTYIDGQGNISTNNEITSVQNNEGYPGLAVDPVSGKPMYAWHANTDSDAALEVQFTSDAFIAGIPGLWNDIITLVDNPTTVVAPGGITTTDNEFIWPVLTVGPSPIAGKRRIYAAMTNNTTHSAIGVSENVLFAYADFDADAIELGTPLAWSYMTVPELDSWNNDSTVLRRFSGGIIADDAGNLYLAGHHFTVDADDNSITEPDLDVFVCPNYGAGTWTRYSASSRLPSWNPNSSPTDTTGYFKDSDNGDIPYGDNELFWEEGASNSNHFNAVFDPDGHKIIIPSIWSLQNTNGYFYLALQFMKEYEFDIQNHTFGIRDVWPIIDPQDDFNLCFTPWDREAPWGVEDGWDGDEQSGYSPTMATAWPYPHWDDTAHENLMMFRYNNVKLSEPNGQGMMVCLWQDCNRARYFHVYNDTEYSAYANTPEIWISVSPDYGRCWSEPIVLNNVDTPEFAGLKPMWAYPADKVVYTGTQGQNLVGKLGVMFYDDYTWGSNAVSPPYHPTPDGGAVMFMELQIVFPLPVSGDDPVVPGVANLLQQNYPNPFNPETTIGFDLPRSGRATLRVFDVKGRLIKILADGILDFGSHSYVWDGTDFRGERVGSGIYFYRFDFGGNVETRKMILLK